MQRRPLPRPPKDNQQVKEYTGAVQRGFNDYYVSYTDKGWQVRKANSSKNSGDFSTEAEAITYARQSVDSEADIIIHGKDGSVTLVDIKTVP
jgi:hypothetical protein